MKRLNPDLILKILRSYEPAEGDSRSWRKLLRFTIMSNPAVACMDSSAAVLAARAFCSATLRSTSEAWGRSIRYTES